MSGYLEARRQEYVEAMRAVSGDGAWTEWCAFFLQGVIEQAAENEAKARAILALYERTKEHVVDLTHSQYAMRAVDYLFQRPIFTAPSFISGAHIPPASAKRILSVLSASGVLRTLRRGRCRRPGVHAFTELLDVAAGKRVV